MTARQSLCFLLVEFFCCMLSSMLLFIPLSLFRFLEEQNKKGKFWENGKNTESNDVDMEQRKVNGKASTFNSDPVPRKYKDTTEGEVSLNSFLKTSPFLSADGGEDEEMIIKPHPKSLHKDWHNGDESSKSKGTPSARELFDEYFGKWQNVAYSQVANSGLDAMAEDFYLSRKQDKAAAIAALAKRELAEKFEELAPDMGGKAKKMAKSPSIPSPSPPARRNSDRDMFIIRSEDSPFMSSRKQEAKLNVRMDFLRDSLIR